ncbi:tetratricopeptide repeat protein [Sphingobacterium deserti]|uniref:TPR repeat-containing protein n=1 Tax=Sphingobacterium deserti TaxID=1229276 RepID=A0A0B8T6V9_9SPHI|nr:tetratricopeptide repeat protein [Sphingobacterium deserti]KGE13165.1 hypothetical protein DI53_3001 [Sphingobacterium deserti]
MKKSSNQLSVRSIIVFVKLLLVAILLAPLLYNYYLGPFDYRFKYAENRQGTRASDYIFSVMSSQYPDRAAVPLERSVAYNKRGLYVKGFELLNKAVAINPVTSLGYRGYMKLYKVRDYAGALSDFERLDSLTVNHVDYPMSENIHFLKAICLYKLGHIDACLSSFDDALETSLPGFVDYKIKLYKAAVLMQMGEYLDSQKLLRSILQEYPKSSEANYYFAVNLLRSNQLIEAKQYAYLAKRYGQEGYTITDAYSELPFAVYPENIEDLINTIEER